MSLAEWRSCDEVLGWPGSQVALSSQGLFEGGGPSSSQKYLSDRPRYEQLLSDNQAGMRGRVVCHQRAKIGKAMFLNHRS